MICSDFADRTSLALAPCAACAAAAARVHMKLKELESCLSQVRIYNTYMHSLCLFPLPPKSSRFSDHDTAITCLVLSCFPGATF